MVWTREVMGMDPNTAVLHQSELPCALVGARSSYLSEIAKPITHLMILVICNRECQYYPQPGDIQDAQLR